MVPDERLAPYERSLADTPPTYRKAWGSWVAERLSLLVGPLRGKVVEVHASEEYLAAIRSHQQASGSTIVEPLRGLSQGRRLRWYDQQLSPAHRSEPPEGIAADVLETYVALLSDHGAAIPPSRLGLRKLRGPGLYSWWVDDKGAAELSVGLACRSSRDLSTRVSRVRPGGPAESGREIPLLSASPECTSLATGSARPYDAHSAPFSRRPPVKALLTRPPLPAG